VAYWVSGHVMEAVRMEAKSATPCPDLQSTGYGWTDASLFACLAYGKPEEEARIEVQKARTVARDHGFPEVVDEQLWLCRRDPEAYARKMAAHEDIPLAYGDVEAVLACRREGASSTLRPPPRGGGDTGYSAEAANAVPRAGPPEWRPAPEGGGTEQEEGQRSSARDPAPTSRGGRTLKRKKLFDEE
jgi:hypothetical protein